MLRVVLLGCLVACHGPSESSDDDSGWCAESAQRTFWQDVDGDGFGRGANTTQCEAPAGFVDNDDDCDDTNSRSGPVRTTSATASTTTATASTDPDAPVWYTDADGDDYGDPKVSQMACERPGGAVTDDTDCDDSNAVVNPGAPEICDGLDNDCDNATDEDFDEDGDGHAPIGACDAGDDCDDTNPEVFPGAPELCNDTIDNDCDGKMAECLFLGHVRSRGRDREAVRRDANFDAGWKLEAADFDGDGKEDPRQRYYANGYHGGALRDADPDSGVESMDEHGSFVAATKEQNEGARAIGAGDIDGDGYDDLLMGGPDSPGDDVALVLGPITADTSWSAADWIATCDDYNECGHGLDVGDVDGDGFEDAVVSSGEWDESGIDAGALFVNYGPLSGEIELTSDSDAKLLGATAHIETGRYVRAGGDLDGDGITDFMATASYDNTGGDSAGAVYMKLGPVLGEYDLADDADGVYVGEAAYDSVGEGIAMGNLDGDGKSDVVAGSITANVGRCGLCRLRPGHGTSIWHGLGHHPRHDRTSGSAPARRRAAWADPRRCAGNGAAAAGATYLFIGPADRDHEQHGGDGDLPWRGGSDASGTVGPSTWTATNRRGRDRARRGQYGVPGRRGLRRVRRLTSRYWTGSPPFRMQAGPSPRSVTARLCVVVCPPAKGQRRVRR
jgi:hypothetical protein